MGITIHWKGSTDDKETAYKVIGYAKFMADALHWSATMTTEQVLVRPVRIDMGNTEITIDQIVHKDWRIYPEIAMNMEKYNARESEEFGVLINPPDPMHTETISITFYRGYKKYIMSEFTKTQVFGNDDVYNLAVHQILVSMLMTIKNTWMPDLEIKDEALFYIPIDKQERQKWLSNIAEEYRDDYRDAKPFNFELLQQEHSALSLTIASNGKLLLGAMGGQGEIGGGGVKSMKDPYEIK